MMRSGSKQDIGIIGAGWSGLAAAIELTRAGHDVTLYESAKFAGGRARRVETEHGVFDNGQHLLIGAYSETLRLMETVSPGSSATGFLRLPLTLDYPDGVMLRAPRLPAPLHLAAALLLAHGFSLAEKMAAINFIRTLQKTDFSPDGPDSVAEAIADQPEKARRFLWEPLCVAALNTPVRLASFKVFARVLRDSLMGNPSSSDFLIPRQDLTSLFPVPAMDWLKRHGGRIKLQHRISALKSENSGWKTCRDTGEEAQHDAIIIATSPIHASTLLDSLPECLSIAFQLKEISYQPIVTVYAEFPDTLPLRTPLTGWTDPVPLFIFDMQATHGRKGMIAAVASAEGPHLDWNDDRWLIEIHTRLIQALGPLPVPKLIKRITEKRATFTCGPKLARPPHTTPCKGLYLAGDYVDGPYPATLEGAVRSGVQCAQLLIRHHESELPTPA
jgi:squalene-associated FAD-dependent desaturase